MAGTGVAGYSGDGGAATAAALNSPTGVAVDTSGDVFISDTGNDRVREVRADGSIVTVAGTGQAGNGGDGGPATAAELRMPAGLAVDAAGDLYIADSGNNAVRVVTRGGRIDTLA